MTVNKERIRNLDFLRGIVIFMAVFEHYTGYLNYWYKDFFIREHDSWATLYASHMPMVNRLLPMDGITANMCLWLVPWVSQIYLALAMFNLASKTQLQVKEKLKKHLFLYTSIIAVLYIEGFVIAPNFGEALSFYPVMLWMVILALSSVIYSYCGIKGMLAMTVMSFFVSQIGVPEALSAVEATVRQHVHPNFELDARVDLFLTSGCLGFVIGLVWHHMPQLRDILCKGVMMWSALALFIFFTLGDLGHVSKFDVYEQEHSLAESTVGHLGIWGAEFLVISVLLLLHLKKIEISWKPINWIGMYSLTVFIFHKSIFIFFWGPIMTLVTAKMGVHLVNNFMIVFLLSSLSILFIYAFKRSGILFHLMGTHQDESWSHLYRDKTEADNTIGVKRDKAI
ncbi:hypothetical protein M9194_06050 [Vibrio sp. S4M6]|uniref:hypothetical protein n=1 Tax=Vibrio sinus TaxID=2946865 RepID=UPI00202A7D75|nr:hypothetical protein [Vibrio sinus]MCL9780993.1 hypothetical protein [Vibrio sinus]